MHKLVKLLFITLLGLMLFNSCKKEKFTTRSSDKLKISTDTMWFDTVFTNFTKRNPKSVNKQIIIVNNHDEKIRTNINLAGGAQSHFRLNVDGEPGYNFNDIEIFPKDSIFLFVEVHPDPNNNSPDFNPLIIRDSIMFQTNGNEQKVNLIGWGQDAHYVFRDSIESDTTWANSALPIVVYGYFYVKPGATLTIEKGMKVHFAPYSWLFVEGNLDIKGTVDEPVEMQGDRLQPAWEETAGQWGGIWFNEDTKGNSIEHALIKNGYVGVFCDSIGDLSDPVVTVKKTHIRNMLYDGVSVKNSNVVMENCIVENCGRYTFLAFGGKSDIKHCTFYMSSKDFGRNGPTMAVLNVLLDDFGNILNYYPLNFSLQNSIVTGNNPEGEVATVLDTKVYEPVVLIDYNLLQTKEFAGTNNLFNMDPKFTNSKYFDFNLENDSPCIDAGRNGIGVFDDFTDKLRGINPDMGALESDF